MRPWPVAAAVAACMALTGCRTEGLAFRQDHRLRIVAPDDRAIVRTPFRLRWTARDLDVGPGRGRFGVFVDVDPPGPGTSLGDFARRYPSCRDLPRCPDRQWLNANGIFITRDSSLVVDFLVDNRPRGRPRARDRHRLTVVVLDARDRRVGETASEVEVFVARPSR